jgi:hypothetical protein
MTQATARSACLFMAPLLACLTVVAACVDHVPAQDRRILTAVPAAKLSVDDLARDYARDRAAADRQYRGKAIEVSGTVGSTRDEETGALLLFTNKDGAVTVEAGLLEDQARAIVTGAAEHPRVTLRCYCDGLNGAVVLRSCVGAGAR